MGTNSEHTVYVKLLNEGTHVVRPTKAASLGNGKYKILPTPDYDPEDENWEFKPGSVVACEKTNGSQGAYLLAVAP